MATPENLESVGAVLGDRSGREAEYLAAIEPEVERFLDEVAALAIAGTLTFAQVTQGWDRALSAAARRLPLGQTATATLATSELPGLAYESATYYSSRAMALDLSLDDRAAWVRSALGREPNPPQGAPGAYGQITDAGENPGHRSWQAESETTARTSATADAASDMVEQLRAEGYTHKRWMTRYDSRVRDTHAAVDRSEVRLDETFMVGGSSLRYPADPLGAAGDVVNCRCLLVGVRYD